MLFFDDLDGLHLLDLGGSFDLDNHGTSFTARAIPLDWTVSKTPESSEYGKSVISSVNSTGHPLESLYPGDSTERSNLPAIQVQGSFMNQKFSCEG